MNKAYISLAALVISLATIVYQAGYLASRVDKIEEQQKAQDEINKCFVSKDFYTAGNNHVVDRLDRIEDKLDSYLGNNPRNK